LPFGEANIRVRRARQGSPAGRAGSRLTLIPLWMAGGLVTAFACGQGSENVAATGTSPDRAPSAEHAVDAGRSSHGDGGCASCDRFVADSKDALNLLNSLPARFQVKEPSARCCELDSGQLPGVLLGGLGSHLRSVGTQWGRGGAEQPAAAREAAVSGLPESHCAQMPVLHRRSSLIARRRHALHTQLVTSRGPQ